MNTGTTITYVYGYNLYVNTTNKCDFSCDFCVRHNSHIGSVPASDLWLRREPTVEEIVRSIESYDLSKFNQLVFCGFGEPTCRFDDICRVIDLLQEDGVKIPTRIDTNGTGCLINRRDICPDFKNRFDRVSISLNTDTAERYEKLCHPAYPGSFEEMLRFAKEVQKYVPEVIMTVVDCISKEEIEHCRHICEDEVGARLKRSGLHHAAGPLLIYRYFPVTLSGQFLMSSSVPAAVMRPPSFPPPGPISTM